ncbi:Phosphatidylinositol-glycan biosynthesis class S protein [Dillenia turbinata]|uniref:Phosphatidylinositol-glycan biosynthesis class S protein n=1 Tax=Dillenia turbinata TaxID=194707 RepID=A0AAN8VF00_9MAGN
MESTTTISKSPDTLSAFILTFSILISFLLGLPFLLKLVEIYRAPLPFHEMDSIKSTHLSFPCKFQVMVLEVCESYIENYTVSITIDSSETLDDSVKNDHIFDELLKGKLEGSGNVYVLWCSL